jgi:hypothetical protein
VSPLRQPVKGACGRLARERLGGRTKGHDMSKVMNLVLEDEDMLELTRILLDDDAEGALEWLRAHLSGKAAHVLEGRSAPKHPRA